MKRDTDLLRQFAETGSQEAFTAVVRDHMTLVYFAALRRTNGDAHLASDISQEVFTRLARNAASLSRHPTLTGWLYTATRNAAIDAVRAAQRRKAREKEAYTMRELHEAPAFREEVGPVLDEALDRLNDSDRSAILLRFFDGLTFLQIGHTLRLTEDSARKRVDRALAKLQAHLSRRGITSTSAALATSLLTEAARAVPPAVATNLLAVTASKTALATAAAAPAAALFTTIMSSKTVVGVASAISVFAASLAVYQVHVAREANAALAAFERQHFALRDELRTAQAKSSRLESDLDRREENKANTQRQPADIRGNAAPSPTPPGDPLTNADARRLAIQQQRVGMELNVRPVFVQLGLSNDQWQKYKALMTEAIESNMDARAAARAQGLSMQDVATVMRKSHEDLRNNLRALLGEDAKKQLDRAASEQPLRNAAGELAGKLIYTDAPLTTEQAVNFVSTLAHHRALLQRTPSGFLLPDQVMSQLINKERAFARAVLCSGANAAQSAR